MASEPVTVEAIEAAGWRRETYVRAADVECWTFSCLTFPELRLTCGRCGARVFQALRVAGRSIPLWPEAAALARAADLIHQARAGRRAPSPPPMQVGAATRPQAERVGASPA